MPWIKQEDCNGCGICVEVCPVNVVFMDNEKADIDMDNCIRCGKCHGICPQEAVRHDSERIPVEVEANMEETGKLMQHFRNKKEKREFLERMIKHFNKEKIVAERTLEKIKILKEKI
ncbi:MAG: 4Fe-4S binding protein [Candidatus Aerophobetes bacterium]|nr:4Fe-4S binding protein [Candidatus Aerophobetes bacterium]